MVAVRCPEKETLMPFLNDFQVHDNLMAQLAESALYIEEKLPLAWRKTKRVGLVLGSGLGGFADRFEHPITIPYTDIPHFPQPHDQAVVGHAGLLKVVSFSEHLTLFCMQGRYHLYEAYSPAQVVYPLRTLKQLDVDTVVITNAAGGINPTFAAGDLMLITDHLNLTGHTPLLGPNMAALGPRFLDMTTAYAPDLQTMVKQAASQLKIPIQQGVYAGLLGPTYETPAEVRMLRTLGADAVGMSTVMEVIAANHMGMAVLGLSCISNLAAGLSGQKLSHTEVMETGAQSAENFSNLLDLVLTLYK